MIFYFQVTLFLRLYLCSIELYHYLLDLSFISTAFKFNLSLTLVILFILYSLTCLIYSRDRQILTLAVKTLNDYPHSYRVSLAVYRRYAGIILCVHQTSHTNSNLVLNCV